MHFVPGSNLVAYVLTASLLLVAVVDQLAANGRITRNGFIGLRIHSTLASDAAWTAGHKAAAVPLWVGFGLTAGAGVLAQFSGVGGIPCVVLFALTLTWGVIAASRAARRVE